MKENKKSARNASHSDAGGEEEENINIEELQKDLEEAKAKCEEYLNGWKRERADFLNYKKEEMERISQMIKYANEELILKILPILDNICLAESHVPESFSATQGKESEEAKWVEGFLQIKKQLSDFLSKEGIEEIKTLYEKFNPNYMEVVEEVSTRNASHNDAGWEKEESGIVIEEILRGYTLHGKVIRPAKVKISK